MCDPLCVSVDGKSSATAGPHVQGSYRSGCPRGRFLYSGHVLDYLEQQREIERTPLELPLNL